jgi:hypothetical protein
MLNYLLKANSLDLLNSKSFFPYDEVNTIHLVVDLITVTWRCCGTTYKSKWRQLRLYQMKMILPWKEPNHQNKGETYKIGII